MTRKITEYQVFGERASGTNYFNKLLGANSVNIYGLRSRGFGWKHGMIFEQRMRVDKNMKLVPFQHRPEEDADDVLFFVIYRNPFTWIQSLQRFPHHAPTLHHLPMSEFISSKWTGYYGPGNWKYGRDAKARKEIQKPEWKFEEYKNVLDLRNQKVAMFETFHTKVKNVCYLNYECLRLSTPEVFKAISDVYGVKLKGNYKEITEDKSTGRKYKAKKYLPFSDKDIKYVIDGLDWKQEKKIGYDLVNQQPKFKKSLFKKSVEVEKPTDLLSFTCNMRFYKDGKQLNSQIIEADR